MLRWVGSALDRLEAHPLPPLFDELLPKHPTGAPGATDLGATLIRRAAAIADQLATMASAIDHEGAFPVAEFGLLREAGLLAAPLAVALGGAGLGYTSPAVGWGETGPLLRVLEEVGRGNLAVGRLLEGHINALLLVQQFGRPEQVAAWATDARLGRLFGVWNTQGADGLHFDRADPLGLVALRGGKTFASGAGWVARPLVTGLRADGMLQMAVVPADEVDLAVDASWWQPLGMRASASHRVDFGAAQLDESRSFLGGAADYLREPWFSVGAIRFAAVQLGGARALLDATVATLQELGRAADPFQQARVGTMAVAVGSARQWLQAAAAVADRIGPAPDREATARAITQAQMTRTAVAAAAEEVLRLAEQSVGARGLIRPHPIERIGRDLTLYLRQPGPDSTLTQIGRAFLDGHPTGPPDATP